MITQTYVKVPTGLATDPTLTPRARAVALVLLTTADRYGQTSPSMEDLEGHGLGSDRTIRRALAELMGAGYLERRRGHRGRTIYTVYRRPRFRGLAMV